MYSHISWPPVWDSAFHVCLLFPIHTSSFPFPSFSLLRSAHFLSFIVRPVSSPFLCLCHFHPCFSGECWSGGRLCVWELGQCAGMQQQYKEVEPRAAGARHSPRCHVLMLTADWSFLSPAFIWCVLWHAVACIRVCPQDLCSYLLRRCSSRLMEVVTCLFITFCPPTYSLCQFECHLRS